MLLNRKNDVSAGGAPLDDSFHTLASEPADSKAPASGQTQTPRRLGLRRSAFIAFVTVLCAVLCAAVYAYTREPVFVLAPETPEEAAQRESGDNAYLVLRDAVRLLPSGYRRSRPWFDDGGGPAAAWARGGQFFERSESEMFSDSPRLRRRAEEWLPAVEHARTALSKPYFRLPVRWSDCETLNNSWYPEEYWEVVFLGRAMITEGSYLSLAPETKSAGVRWLIDALKLGAMLASDGPGREGRDVQAWALERICLIANTMDKALLTSTLTDICAAANTVAPPARNLEFSWRILDNTRRWDPSFTDIDGGPRSSGPALYGKDLVFSVALRQVRSIVAAHRAELQDAVSLSYPQALRWMDTHSDLSLPQSERRAVINVLGRNYWPLLRPVLSPIVTVRGYVEDYARLRTWLVGAENVLALELYRRDHGAYPESLEALVPAYLADVPADPFSGMPLEYRAENEDYLLFSAGPVPNGGFGAMDGQYELVLHQSGAHLK